MKSILMEDVMVKDPHVLDIDDKLSTAEEYFHLYNIRHLPVIDKAGVLVGIFSQRDLYRLLAPRRGVDGEEIYDKMELDDFILKEVMTKNPFTLRPNDTLDKAVKAMVTEKYGCIPRVDDQNTRVGIVTQIDVLKAIAYRYLT